MNDDPQSKIKTYDGALDLAKLSIDITKHLTTLCTAVIVFAATFHDKLQSARHFGWGPGVAISLFLLSLVTGVKALSHTLKFASSVNILRDNAWYGISRNDDFYKKKIERNQNSFNFQLLVSLASFAFGSAILVAFTIANVSVAVPLPK